MTIQPLFMKIIGTMLLNEDTWHELKPVIGMTITEPTLIGSRLLHKHMIVLDQPGVSRRQARIIVKEGHWYLEDLGSDNATWLLTRQEQKRRLKGPTLIVQDMVVLFGAVVVQFGINTIARDLTDIL